MRIARIVLIALALAAVALSLYNASWLAPRPQGRLALVAHRGIAQPPAGGEQAGDCRGVAIAKGAHNYLENTVYSMKEAIRFGGDVLALPVQRTADNRIVAFRDATLDCRTDGSGPVSARTLEELKKLDAGYRYTPDGGATFPLRGRVGAIQSLEEVLSEIPGRRHIFSFVTDDPAAADAMAATFARAGAAIDGTIGFIGPEPVLARMRRLAPEAWTFDAARSGECIAAYRTSGWVGIVPEPCRGATLAVPLDSGFGLWGWPYRFIDRVEGVGARVMIVERLDEKGHPVGISEPQQLGEVPRQFTGMLWVDNMYDVGRALRN